jgi:hypothetical protein
VAARPTVVPGDGHFIVFARPSRNTLLTRPTLLTRHLRQYQPLWFILSYALKSSGRSF